MKNLLILKAHHDICGDEIGLITHQGQFLGINVKEETVDSEQTLIDIFKKFSSIRLEFDFVYLCTHADRYGFDIEMGINKTVMTWGRFGQLVCESGILNDNTVFLLACCRGGLFKVATDMFAVCNKINFVCGAKWTLRPADLATGFVVFLYNICFKKAEPFYASQKATLATDYSFVCHDRAEIESHPQYEHRRFELYKEIGWVDDAGVWVETDKTIKENTGIN
jgi:hypothetical protein